MDEAEDFDTAMASLLAATEQYENAKQRESAARMEATEALNRLNKAQAIFDRAIEKIKTLHSPSDSDWHRLRKG